jgi:ankyrin repeat protein
MTHDGFIQLVLGGDEAAALRELEADPTLASSRDAQGVSVVCLAVYRQSKGLALALVQRRTDLDLFEAACVGNVERVLELLGAHPEHVNRASPDGFSAAGYSCFFGHVELLEALIERGADVNAQAKNPMRVCPVHSAAAQSDPVKSVELTRLLLEAGADPNAQQAGEFTALHEAARKGNVALIKLLLESGADRRLAAEKVGPPVELAQSNGHAEAARLLQG